MSVKLSTAEILRNLTNDGVARLLLRRLWQVQDAGGVSMGRALRNCFLESAISIMPAPDVPRLDAFSEHDLFLESRRRGRAEPSVAKLDHSARLARVSNRSLAILLLECLWEWYKEDQRKDPLMGFFYEMQVMCAALQLLPLSKEAGAPVWEPELLVDEARDRYTRRLRRENDRLYV